jgi:hypothetical protein
MASLFDTYNFFEQYSNKLVCMYCLFCMASNYIILPKVLQHVKKSLYNQPKPYFFQKILWSHFWIDFNKFNTKTFRIVYILIVYLLIMLMTHFLLTSILLEKKISSPFVQFSRLRAEHKLVQNIIGTLMFFYLSLFVCFYFCFCFICLYIYIYIFVCKCSFIYTWTLM